LHVFFLGASCAYVWHTKNEHWTLRGGYGVVCAGLLSKVMVVTLPLALLVMDYWPFRGMKNERQDGSVGKRR